MKLLSGLDAACLYLDTPNAPMNVVATLILDPSSSPERFSHARVVDLLRRRMPRLAPFRRRLAQLPAGLARPVWIEDPDFRVERHVHRAFVPAPGSDRCLARLVAQVAARQLDRTRPLWDVHVVEGLSGGRSALVAVVHHAVADGISGAELLARLLDVSATPPAASEPPPEPWTPDAVPGIAELAGLALRDLSQQPARIAQALAGAARATAGLVRTALGPEHEFADAALPGSTPRTRLSGSLSPRRSVAYARLRRADLEFVRHNLGGTLNDVVLATCAGALRHWLAAHGEPTDRPLLAAVPVSARRPDEAGTFGNRISTLFVRLPVHLEDPHERLLVIGAEARRAKRLASTVGHGALGDWCELMSPALFTWGARLYGALGLADHHPPTHSLVVSNVPGPPVPLYVAGARVLAAFPHGPVLQGAGLNITVMSYVDSVDFGVLACRERVPDPWDLAAGFGAEVGDLMKLALEETGGRRPGREVA